MMPRCPAALGYGERCADAEAIAQEQREAVLHMNLTPHHAKFFAYELTKRCPSDSIEKLAGALVDAQVDLNPHQVEAALFAFQSPLRFAMFIRRRPTKRASQDMFSADLNAACIQR